jgi:hypothetical protein
MNPNTSSKAGAAAGSGELQAPIAWWRVPMVWLVWGGPAAVVVASLATGVIAWKHIDPVVEHDTGAYSSTAHVPAEEHHLDAPRAPQHR